MWKEIQGYNGYYSVNDKGEIRNNEKGTLIQGDINNAGYYRVCLYRGNKKHYFRHRLVAEYFIPNPNNFTEVNHIDGDKSNNSVNNLEWVDRTTNEREARKTGLKEFKPFYVIWQDGTREEFDFPIDLAKKLNVTDSCIRNYLKKRSNGYSQKGIKEIEYL